MCKEYCYRSGSRLEPLDADAFGTTAVPQISHQRDMGQSLHCLDSAAGQLHGRVVELNLCSAVQIIDA